MCAGEVRSCDSFFFFFELEFMKEAEMLRNGHYHPKSGERMGYLTNGHIILNPEPQIQIMDECIIIN